MFVTKLRAPFSYVKASCLIALSRKLHPPTRHSISSSFSKITPSFCCTQQCHSQAIDQEAANSPDLCAGSRQKCMHVGNSTEHSIPFSAAGITASLAADGTATVSILIWLWTPNLWADQARSCQMYKQAALSSPPLGPLSTITHNLCCRGQSHSLHISTCAPDLICLQVGTMPAGQRFILSFRRKELQISDHDGNSRHSTDVPAIVAGTEPQSMLQQRLPELYYLCK